MDSYKLIDEVSGRFARLVAVATFALTFSLKGRAVYAQIFETIGTHPDLGIEILFAVNLVVLWAWVGLQLASFFQQFSALLDMLSQTAERRLGWFGKVVNILVTVFAAVTLVTVIGSIHYFLKAAI